MRFVNENGLRADVTVNGIWPEHKGVSKPVDQWTDEDRIQVRRKNDELLKHYA